MQHGNRQMAVVSLADPEDTDTQHIKDMMTGRRTHATTAWGTKANSNSPAQRMPALGYGEGGADGYNAGESGDFGVSPTSGAQQRASKAGIVAVQVDNTWIRPSGVGNRHGSKQALSPDDLRSPDG